MCLSLQKYNDRKAMAGKGKYLNEEQKEKWMALLKPEVMSSDDTTVAVMIMMNTSLFIPFLGYQQKLMSLNISWMKKLIKKRVPEHDVRQSGGSLGLLQ